MALAPGLSREGKGTWEGDLERPAASSRVGGLTPAPARGTLAYCYRRGGTRDQGTTKVPTHACGYLVVSACEP